jgi:hypothetical protein
MTLKVCFATPQLILPNLFLWRRRLQQNRANFAQVDKVNVGFSAAEPGSGIAGLGMFIRFLWTL